MEKDPADRIQSAAEVVARLQPWTDEAVAVPSEPMVKSRWMPPPLPTGVEELEQLSDTSEGSYDAIDSESSQRGSSQWSQGTDPLATSNQDTLRIRSSRRRKAPPLTLGYPYTNSHRDLSVPIALAVSIPLSLLVGIVIGFLLSGLLGGP